MFVWPSFLLVFGEYGLCWDFQLHNTTNMSPCDQASEQNITTQFLICSEKENYSLLPTLKKTLGNQVKTILAFFTYISFYTLVTLNKF